METSGPASVIKSRVDHLRALSVSLERVLDRVDASFHHFTGPPVGLVGQQVGYPDEERAASTRGENLGRGVVVGVGSFDDRPHEGAGGFVKVDQPFTRDDAVEEGYDPVA